jgi:hypothetical protein
MSGLVRFSSVLSHAIRFSFPPETSVLFLFGNMRGEMFDNLASDKWKWNRVCLYK